MYILRCTHPLIKDVSDDEDETYYDVVYERGEHQLPEKVKNDKTAVSWVEKHIKDWTRTVRDVVSRPKDLRLVKVIKEWPKNGK